MINLGDVTWAGVGGSTTTRIWSRQVMHVQTSRGYKMLSRMDYTMLCDCTPNKLRSSCH